MLWFYFTRYFISVWYEYKYVKYSYFLIISFFDYYELFTTELKLLKSIQHSSMLFTDNN